MDLKEYILLNLFFKKLYSSYISRSKFFTISGDKEYE